MDKDVEIFDLYPMYKKYADNGKLGMSLKRLEAYESRKEELYKLLDFLERTKKEHEDDRFFEVCIDCKEVVKDIGKHQGHLTVLEDFEHSGVSEWIRCLKYVLGKEVKE